MLNFNPEKKFGQTIIGVDEVGRGPWAGPVIAAACQFTKPNNTSINLEMFNDSKKLTQKKRHDCYQHILSLKCLSLIKFTIGKASVAEIDRLNILQASLLAMKRAIMSMKWENTFILIDGIHKPYIKGMRCKTFIKGDEKFISIAAASIIAKVTRDNLMKKLAKSFPQYGWENNMGYGTAKHAQAIKLIGINQHHRKTFKPILQFIHNNS